MTTQTDVPTLELLALAQTDDPYPGYARMRAHGPVVPADLPITWGVTRHADVSELLRDRRLSSCFPRHFLEYVNGPGPSVELAMNLLTATDPPDHTRLRKLMSRAFGGLVVRKLAEHVGQLVDDLIEPALDGGTFDVIDDLAFPLPFLVICEILDIDVEDRDAVRAGIIDLTSAEVDKRHAAAAWTRGYMDGVLRGRTPDADGDLFQRMLAAEDGDEALAHQEIVDNAILLFLAGFETTMNLVGNGVQALIDHPDQLAKLLRAPELAPLAVEEFLRYDTPVPIVNRLTTEPVLIGDQEIPAMNVLCLILASANRDAAAFTQPDVLDITRKPNPHVGFGGGIHHCMGAMLARLEGEIVFTRLAQRLSGIEPAGEPERRYNSIRGYSHLPVYVT